MTLTEHNILIVGAGPSGLTLATELTRRGIACTIVDKAASPSPLHESRALAFNLRSQRILEASGVTNNIKKSAHQVERVRFCWKRQLRNEISLLADANKIDPITVIRQGQIERKILAHLSEQGVEVHWGSEITHFTEKNNRILATLTDKNGDTCTYQCRYLVGCDGAHSFVRKNGGYSFDGESDSQNWTVADVSMQDDRFAHAMTIDLSPGKVFATVPIEDNLVRFIHNGTDLLAQHPFAHLRTDIVWQSEFKISYRLVKLYNRGLTFLCGDAAHIHSPVGGRGMNLGIEDAATLAWLLEKGRESEYSELRRPVAQQVLKITHNQSTQMNSASLASSIGKKFGPKLVSISAVRQKILRSLHGLDTPEPAWLKSV